MDQDWVQTDLRDAGAATRWHEEKLACTNWQYALLFSMERLADMLKNGIQE